METHLLLISVLVGFGVLVWSVIVWFLAVAHTSASILQGLSESKVDEQAERAKLRVLANIDLEDK